MKAVQDKTHPMHDNKDIKKYVRKYKSCMCTKIKADMRNMWKLANCDFEMAASVLIAREHAYKETKKNNNNKKENKKKQGDDNRGRVALKGATH